MQGIAISFNVAAVSAIVPQVSADLGVSAFVAGRINWAYMLPYGLVALLYGPLTRRFDAKYIITFCLICFSFFSFLSGSAKDYNSLFVFRFLVGAFASATTPLVLIYISTHAPESQRGRYIGGYFGANFCADLAGLFLSGIVPWRAMFFIPSCLGILAAYFTIKKFPECGTTKADSGSHYIQAFKDPLIFNVFLYIFVISLLYYGVRQWLGVYFAKELGMNQFFVSMILTLCSLAGVFGELVGGVLSDKKGRVSTLKAGILIIAVAVLALSLLRAKWLIAVMMLLFGFGWTINHAGLSTYLTDLNKKYMKEISSLNSSVRFLAGGLGVIIGGFIMQKSFAVGFFIYGAILVAVYFFTDKILNLKYSLKKEVA